MTADLAFMVALHPVEDTVALAALNSVVASSDAESSPDEWTKLLETPAVHLARGRSEVSCAGKPSMLLAGPAF